MVAMWLAHTQVRQVNVAACRLDNLLTCKKLQSKKDVHNDVTPSLHHSLHSACIINIEINNQY